MLNSGGSTVDGGWAASQERPLLTKRAISAVVVTHALILCAGCRSTTDRTTLHSPNIGWRSSVERFVGASPASTYAFTPITPGQSTLAGSAIYRRTLASYAGERRDSLAVLSFNMQHRDQPTQLAVMAGRLGTDFARLPDFVLCQEVLFQRSRSKGHDNTAAVLADLLGYYCQGTKRTSDREGVAIISRYPFDYYDYKDLEARTAGVFLGFRRVSVMGEFLIPGIGRVRVVNAHFAHWGFEHHVRRRQLQETLEWIAQRQREVPADITFFGGDFNIKPDWDEMSLLTGPAASGELQFEDFNSSAPTRGPQGHPNARIDYVFVAAPHRDVRIVAEELLWLDGLRTDPGGRRFWLSDHVPLLHEYAISPAALATPMQWSARAGEESFAR